MKLTPIALAVSAALALSLASALADDTALRAKAKSVGLQALPYGAGQVTDNALTREKIVLGTMLFFDPRLSASGVISCNTCHNLGTGGDDNLPTSVGHGWQKGPRNAPTVLNAVYNKAQFWDGRAEDLKAQAKGPVQAGVEMANLPTAVVETPSLLRSSAAFEPTLPKPWTIAVLPSRTKLRSFAHSMMQ